MKPRILFGCKVADKDARARILAHADITELENCTEAELLRAIPGHEAVIVPYTEDVVVTRAVIDAGGTTLKLAGTTYGGTRQSIDDVYAIEHGLQVIHTGPTRPRPMAEYTLALVLSSLLEVHNYHHDMNSKEPWPRFKYPRSRILHNRSVGIIGFGMIGRGIYDLFRCFTSDIRVCSRHLSQADAAALGVTLASINEVFAQCEVIILSGGHTSSTTHLVGAEQFALMQERALFVNIARGQMVDERAMEQAAANRNINFALDVFEVEPLPENSPLRGRPNVLLTPHRANNPIEFEQRWAFLADELDRYFSGERPQTSLTLERVATMSES